MLERYWDDTRKSDVFGDSSQLGLGVMAPQLAVRTPQRRDRLPVAPPFVMRDHEADLRTFENSEDFRLRAK